jgi:hypothetical protein
MAKSKKSTGVKASTRRADHHRVKKPRLPKAEYLDWRTFDPSMFAPNPNFKLMDELFTYKHHLDDLLRDEGKYVLIKGREIVGIYANRGDAVREALERFGDEPVLIKEIAVKERIHSMGGGVY